jgi:hypothetical protein
MDFSVKEHFVISFSKIIDKYDNATAQFCTGITVYFFIAMPSVNK